MRQDSQRREEESRRCVRDAGMAYVTRGFMVGKERGHQSSTHLTSFAGVDAVMEATGFVTTDTAEDGGSVEFCGTEKSRKKVRRRGREESRTAVGQKEDLRARHPFPRMEMESKVKGAGSGKQAVIVTSRK